VCHPAGRHSGGLYAVRKIARGTPLRVIPTGSFTGYFAPRVEPNSDGYLFRPRTMKATMLFPNERLSHGDNRALAHVPYEIPSGLEPRSLTDGSSSMRSRR
jgi:hypothetical protein